MSDFVCVVGSLGAASDCLKCVCDVLNDFVDGAVEECVDEDPGHCTDCAAEIAQAAEDCADEDVVDQDCAEEVLGAASDCLACVCDVINLVEGGEGECGGPVAASP